jgi:hypothetical protein
MNNKLLTTILNEKVSNYLLTLLFMRGFLSISEYLYLITPLNFNLRYTNKGE